MTEFVPLQLGSPRIGRPPARGRSGNAERKAFAAPPRPEIDYIPSPGVMQEIIDRAREAFAFGIIWDRGSILNLLV